MHTGGVNAGVRRSCCARFWKGASLPRVPEPVSPVRFSPRKQLRVLHVRVVFLPISSGVQSVILI